MSESLDHLCSLRYVVVDLEATCWESRTAIDKMETIEIGALVLQSASGPINREFSSFVKPVASPILSEFCRNLTSITQDQVDSADYFWVVFPQFVEWIGLEPFVLCSWGAYDLTQLKADCQRSSMHFPEALENHINLKKEFANINGTRPMGMAQALSFAKIPLTGTYHRGIDDARNIAKLAMSILPHVESERKQSKTP